ncbi:aldo/keto reductase [Foetidibacter luteolus]|uniref:aldo/keto reductase n=1 Tax=Foetidibacter luteolus TaxID=2608880 RepID=UPI00129AC06B|nr:aldo/keto reductase [Foetidibacter luteolus]
MEKRKLGNSGLEAAPLAFGGNVFGWTIDEPSSFKILDAFVGEGFNLIDTANAYSRWAPGNKGGESETIIGNWMKKNNNRRQVLIATKVGADMGEGKNLSKAYILKEAEKSLKRLQTDYIDLYQSHYDDEVTPVEETMEAYAQLVKEGKVRAVGTSNMSPERLLQSLEASETNHLPRYETLQPLYNLYDREKFEREYEPVCLERNIGVLNYYALASGFLTGKYRSEADLDKSARGQGSKKYLNAKGFAILEALDKVSAEYNTTPAAVAIAWLLARPSVTAPIASATSVEQLESLVNATKLVLSGEALALLDVASS